MRKCGSKCETLCDMRRSIDDYPMTSSDVPAGDDDAMRISWAVAICDDYDDAEPRVVLTSEEVGSPGTGLVAHLSAEHVRRLRSALRDALREIGEDPGL
jgi:hypothetical protein